MSYLEQSALTGAVNLEEAYSSLESTLREEREAFNEWRMANDGLSQIDKFNTLLKKADAYILALRQVVYSNRADIRQLASGRLNELGSSWCTARANWDICG